MTKADRHRGRQAHCRTATGIHAGAYTNTGKPGNTETAFLLNKNSQADSNTQVTNTTLGTIRHTYIQTIAGKQSGRQPDIRTHRLPDIQPYRQGGQAGRPKYWQSKEEAVRQSDR